jgi:alpha-glucosidase
VVYQIYVRSFADSDADGIGDLAGICSRIAHLSGLGVDAVWLTPLYPSPQRDHGYDVADYLDIEPQYGDLADFDALVAACRAAGIRVLMDVVPNHCSSQHAWFQEALAAPPGDPARHRFWFRDGHGHSGELPPNNWVAEFGGSAWTRVSEADGTPGQWYLHTFTPWQPDFDWSHPDVVEHFDRVLGFWFDRGVDGFRVDAIQFVGKAPGLPDTAGEEPVAPPRNPHLSFVESGHDVWRHWRATVDEYERTHPGREVFLVGEAYTPRRPDLLAAYVSPDEFHQAFSFDLLLSPWNADTLRTAIDDPHRMLTAAGTSVTWVLNNHDVQRAVTRYGRLDAHDVATYTGSPLAYSASAVDVSLGTRRARAAAVMVAALPGSLYVYQGEELGLPEVLDLPDEARTDPIFARTAGAEIGRDGCRVPIPWDDDPATAFGFATSAATPWLPQPAQWATFAIARQEDEADSMLGLYRNVLRLRRELTPHDGALQWVLTDHPALLAFARGDIRVVLNPTAYAVELPSPDVAARVVLSSLAGHDDPHVVPTDTCLWLAG